MLRKLYDWVLALAASNRAPWALAAVSFAESSFFPIPPDVMLAPMVAARPDRAYRYAAICTAASVLGGLVGYAIGVFLDEASLGLLLASALWLAWMMHQAPFVHGWLTAKVLGLLAYIVLGSIALRRGRTSTVRTVAFAGALLAAAYVVAVALTKDPLPFRI